MDNTAKEFLINFGLLYIGFVILLAIIYRVSKRFGKSNTKRNEDF